MLSKKNLSLSEGNLTNNPSLMTLDLSFIKDIKLSKSSEGNIQSLKTNDTDIERKSKLSIKLNSMTEYKKYIEEQVEDLADNDIINDEDLLNNEEYYHYVNNTEMALSNKKFEVICYIKVNNMEFRFPIRSDSLNIKKQYTYELIRNIVYKINHQKAIIKDNSNKYILSLRDTDEEDKINFYINNYELRLFNKENNLPNYDLPSINPTSLLKQISNELICFIPKNSVNIMLIKYYDDNIEITGGKIIFINKVKNGSNNSLICNKTLCGFNCILF